MPSSFSTYIWCPRWLLFCRRCEQLACGCWKPFNTSNSHAKKHTSSESIHSSLYQDVINSCAVYTKSILDKQPLPTFHSTQVTIPPYDVYLVDLDGTVYLGDQLLPTARQALQNLRHLGRRVIFITNEASMPPEGFAKRLDAFGIPTSPQDVISSASALIDFLNQRIPGGRLFVIGEPTFCSQLQSAGFHLVENPSTVDAVIASHDHGFDYRKLQIAFNAIRSGAAFYATNADRTLPLPGGGEEPDALPIIAAIEACTEHPLDEMVGKPSVHMANAALRLAGVSPDRCLLVGDNPETDILMGLNAGMDTALVLTGVAALGKPIPPHIQPRYVIQQLVEVVG